MAVSTLRIASRRSKLARVQAEQVAAALTVVAPDLKIEFIEILSDGCMEKFSGNLAEAGGKGLFVKALEKALLENEVDIAVHSMKDVPTDEDMDPALTVPAVLPRADRRDAVVCREGQSFANLPKGAKIGTSSLRRTAQLARNLPYLNCVHIRGNVDTRLAKLDAKEVDAVILAKAGLDRLGLSHRITDVLEPDIMCPAAGQGIVGIQCRSADTEIIKLLQKINHQHTHFSLLAERAMLQKLQGDCFSAIGGYCEVTKSGENLRMIAMVAAPDGSKLIWSRQKFPIGEHIQIGEATAEDLLAQGARELLDMKKK